MSIAITAFQSRRSPNVPKQSLSMGGPLQCKCACGSAASSLTGECEECQSKSRLQAKLTIGASDDPREREADRIADQVLAAGIDRAIGYVPPRVQRYVGKSGRQMDAAPPSVDRVLAGTGNPLEPILQNDMEQRFGHDFSRVRVHLGTEAEQSAREVNARAYTVGHNIVFASGQFEPRTHEGQRLIAHELVHVVQQNSSTGATARPTLARAVRETVHSSTQPGAQVCMVHLHGDEENARQVALSLFGTHCANFVDLSSTTRAIHVDETGGTCLVDPNRIFTPNGIAHHAFGRCPAALRSLAEADLVNFRDHQLIPAIAACRGRNDGGLSGGLPLIAFHNNSGLSITDYQPRGSSATAAETDPGRTGGTANPSVASGRSPQDYILTTDPRDFAALASTHNVVLQSSTIPIGGATDDGSLSVALANDRYVNIEGFGKTFTNRSSRFYVTNMVMALDVFRQLGVGRKPCLTESAPVGELPDRIIDFFGRLFGEIVRLLEQLKTLPEPVAPEILPAPTPRGCRIFTDATGLNARKADWIANVAGMRVADVVSWIIGINPPSRTARNEADRQRSCLMNALSASGNLGMGISTAPMSGYRSFADQRAIWDRKFDFVYHGHLDRRNRFDSITAHARTRCGSLIAAGDVQWNTENPLHRACWGAHPLPATPAKSVPGAPAGGPLSDDEKQQEILQASSAPGISRHHFGTDFDFFSVEPPDWAPGGRFFDTYRWLRANAMTYGFVQTFTPVSTFMRLGYMEERWHWSYYPIAQALLEFAHMHWGDIEANLISPRHWGGAARFNYILSHWQEFMFNVEQTP